MTLSTRLLLLALAICLLVIGVGAYVWHVERQTHATVLSAKDAAFQRANEALGTAQAQQVTQAALVAEYAAKVKAGEVPDARPFLKEHGARVDAILSATGAFPAIKSANGTLVRPELDFRVTGVIIKKGALETAQLGVQPLDSTGKPNGPLLPLRNIELDHAPPPPEPFWAPHVIAEVGILVPPQLPLQASPSVGLGASLVQLGPFGAQLTAFVGLARLEDSGGALALTWRPTLLDRTLNVGVSAGVAVTVTGVVAPRVAAVFWVW